MTPSDRKWLRILAIVLAADLSVSVAAFYSAKLDRLRTDTRRRISEAYECGMRRGLNTAADEDVFPEPVFCIEARSVVLRQGESDD